MVHADRPPAGVTMPTTQVGKTVKSRGGDPVLEGRVRRKRVLLAEDDSAFRALLGQHLERGGFEVVAVADGTEVLERLSYYRSGEADDEGFDIVVSDVRMPGWTGLNILATMRQDVRAPPVVLLTAFGDDELHRQAYRIGASAVLDKPVELDDLRALVGRLVGA
jgi:CheY-like chemotaxis protein